MKNSTILFAFGVVGLGGVGAYLYLKNKKASNDTTTPNDKNTSTATSSSNSDVNSSLGLPLPVDKVVALYNETQTENYKKAKLLSNEIQTLNARIPAYRTNKTKNALRREIADKTAQANALGYKILDYGEIEKI